MSEKISGSLISGRLADIIDSAKDLSVQFETFSTTEFDLESTMRSMESDLADLEEAVSDAKTTQDV